MKIIALSALALAAVVCAAPAYANGPRPPAPPSNTQPPPPAPPTLPTLNFNIGGGFSAQNLGGAQFDGNDGYSMAEGGSYGSLDLEFNASGNGCTVDCTTLGWNALGNAGAHQIANSGAMSGISGQPALSMGQVGGLAGVNFSLNKAD